jgi:chromosome segregation ATPase
MTSPRTNDTVRIPKELRPEAERDGLHAALAAARGTILDLRSHLADLRAEHEFLRLSNEATAAKVRKLQDRLAATQAELSARENALLAERNWLLDVRDTHVGRLRELEPIVQQVASLAEERDTLARRAESLDRLVRDLRWKDGPRSVRAILPLARLLRRIGGG